MKIRDLRANEIDCRVQTVSDKGFSLLLYKDARVDMDILDETFGIFGWQRIHSRDNANCTILIWDKENKQWISKEDTGTESFTEKEKGLASDSFKRAGFNVGIGRELYTAPFIWISDTSYLKDRNGKKTVYEKFIVKDIEIVDKVITKLTISDSRNKVVFTYDKGNTISPQKETKKPFDKKKAEKCILELIGDNTDLLEKEMELKGIKSFAEADERMLKMLYKDIKARLKK